MGTEIQVIGDGMRAAQKLLISDGEFTSVIVVQGQQHMNIGIRVGSDNSDILSYYAYSMPLSTVASTFSGIITLQRRMKGETQEFEWRDVDTWSIFTTDGTDGSDENTTITPEPETCEYRAGVKTGEYFAGAAIIRIGN